LAHRWNWTPKTVRGFLDKLEEEGMILRFAPSADDVLTGPPKGKHKGKLSTVLTVSKYSLYQLGDRVKGQDAGQVEGKLGASSGHDQGNIYKEETREQGNKGTSKPEPTQAQAEGLAGLNGSADLMLADVKRWMHGGDETSARKWLSSTCSIYGQDVVKDAWIKLGTDMLSGNSIAQPLPTWAKIAARMRDDRKRAPPVSKRDEAMAKIKAIEGPRR
jgi:hypothetical protein